MFKVQQTIYLCVRLYMYAISIPKGPSKNANVFITYRGVIEKVDSKHFHNFYSFSWHVMGLKK